MENYNASERVRALLKQYQSVYADLIDKREDTDRTFDRAIFRLIMANYRLDEKQVNRENKIERKDFKREFNRDLRLKKKKRKEELLAERAAKKEKKRQEQEEKLLALLGWWKAKNKGKEEEQEEEIKVNDDFINPYETLIIDEAQKYFDSKKDLPTIKGKEEEKEEEKEQTIVNDDDIQLNNEPGQN